MEPTCWLCRRPASLSRYLHRPCRCDRAGIGLVHVPCLDEWLGESAKNRACPMCRAAYPLEHGPAPSVPFEWLFRQLLVVVVACALLQGAVGALAFVFRYQPAALSLAFWATLCIADLLATLLVADRWRVLVVVAACATVTPLVAPRSIATTTLHVWACATVVCGGLYFLRIAFRGKWPPPPQGRARLRRIGSADNKLS